MLVTTARPAVAAASAKSRHQPALSATQPRYHAYRRVLGAQRRLEKHRTAAVSDGKDQAAPSSSTAAAAADAAPETTYYEGSGSNAELAVSLLLGATLIYLPLTLASVGRRLWIKWRFTNKRLIVTTDSPILKREVQVSYDKIREIRTAPRAFGAWGDMVVFLKDGSRLELIGIERYDELKKYVESKMT